MRGVTLLGFAASVAALCGCTDPQGADFPFAGYYSQDGRIAVEFPRWKDGVEDPVNRKWYTPVVVHYREKGRDSRVVTNMCCEVDRGSCGNYALESRDGLMLLEDYSYCNNGDPEAIFVSITFRAPDKSTTIIPLNRVGLD